MLELRDLWKTYHGPQGPVVALAGVSLSLRPGEWIAVRGPSGSGKTTLLLAAGGMLSPEEGEVIVGSTSVYALSTEARSRFRAANVGFVFQQFHLLPYLSVLENVLTPGLARGGNDLPGRARDLCRQVGLEQRLRHRPSELSSGERQRCALARALLHRPPLVLADEPTGNLDDQSAGLILDHLAEYVSRGGALLLVTHDARAAQRAHRVLNMSAGKIQ